MPRSENAFFFCGLVSAVTLAGTCVFRMANSYQADHAVPAPTAMASGVMAADVVGDGRNSVGSPTAPCTLVEFADFECPPCAITHAELSRLLPAAEAQGKLRFVFRHYPLTSIHPDAWEAACAAEAAGEQKQFWQMYNQMYAHQDHLAAPDLMQFAATLPIDQARFRRAMKTTATRNVKTDAGAAKQLKLEGTPTLLLCGPGREIRQVTVAWLEQQLQNGGSIK